MVKKNNAIRVASSVLAVLVLMLLIVFAVGKSFGFFQHTKQGNVINVVSIKGLRVNVDNTTDSALNLVGAFPVYDSVGLSNDSFVFTINNTSSGAIDYTLKLLNDEDKQATCFTDQAETIPCSLLPYQYIKYAYSINNGAYSTPANLTSSGAIYSETIAGNSSTTIAIKIWIDSMAPNSIQGTAFYGMLLLTGEKSLFNSNLPSTITSGASYTIARTAEAGETITCSSNVDGTVTNTSTLTVGTHQVTCTSTTDSKVVSFTRNIVVQ